MTVRLFLYLTCKILNKLPSRKYSEETVIVYIFVLIALIGVHSILDFGMGYIYSEFSDLRFNISNSTTNSSNSKESTQNTDNGGRFDFINPKKPYLTNPLYDRNFPLIKADREKAEAVKEAFLHAWNPYKKYCWGEDEYVANSNRCHSTLRAGLTIVDSLSTLYLMNLTEDFQKARDYIEKDFKPNGSWSLFEFIIRFVGGFISIYQLSNDKLFLDKAVESAEAIFPLMQKGIFGGGIRLSIGNDGKMKASGSSGGWNSLADTSTFQLEFITLSMLTGDRKYIDLAAKTYKIIWESDRNNGLVDGHNGVYNANAQKLHVGAGTDSYFEYVIKIYVLLRGYPKIFLERYLLITRDIKEKLVMKTTNGITGLGIYKKGNQIERVQEHLATFAGGMFAVGTVKDNPQAAEDFRLADALSTGYYKAYESTVTGVGGERMIFNSNGQKDFDIQNGVYMLRPESCESVYVMYKFTGLPKWRDYAWRMFSAINKHARREQGFAWINNVNNTADNAQVKGTQESFFFAETLKYLYLTFSDTTLISPAEWVFNTEGHPIKIFSDEDAKKWAKYLDIRI